MKFFINNNYVEAHINEHSYYCTGKDGYGLYYVNSSRNDRKQILGTSQFSIANLKDKSKKAKIRKEIARG